jgi:hypothetical protein
MYCISTLLATGFTKLGWHSLFVVQSYVQRDALTAYGHLKAKTGIKHRKSSKGKEAEGTLY